MKKICCAIVEAGSSKKNKTGSWRVLRPKVLKEKCGKCLLCLNFCPEGCIELNHKISIDYDYCKGCGICASECPRMAVIMEKEEK
ncbi:MAG: 4Fe-4S binding protein [Candidatus Pacearchaeota archaeon]|nr:4Fe-4S binding protein [Candidatus Pacearchaeota archaeon]